MISAMPAVAVRQERQKNKSYKSGRERAQSLTAVSSPHDTHLGILSRRSPRRTCRVDQQMLRLFIYVGTVLLVAGLVLVFIGVGTGVSTSQTIGLVFIGIGVLFSFVKVFLSEQQFTFAKRPKLTNAAKESLCAVIVAPTTNARPSGEAANLKSPSQRPPLSQIEECGAITQSNQNSSLSPTGLSSIPETEVLIMGRENKRAKF
ncbi:uncharacterized protein LOC143244489 [Tachypleus tridentatus]|uniref:uncharacterized protein LOC143244489 n=1 Tax=Tachypleus tridentatus TaxID=6853 RepID=UPI003FD5918E